MYSAQIGKLNTGILINVSMEDKSLYARSAKVVEYANIIKEDHDVRNVKGVRYVCTKE